ncbi:hypothetical protein FRC12_006267 [Ceratobasidium sp. 428]|nr:hypothetical protein FRC12_006267 [Ceratobasidium sp. 428]
MEGLFTLLHAYTLLSLLWLIALAGLMIHVHTWITKGQNEINRSSISWIWNGTRWYLLQVETLGVYGYYVCTNRDRFPRPPCSMPIFDNGQFRTFAKVIYMIAMIPVVNVFLFGVPLFGLVWIFSTLATLVRGHYTDAKTNTLYIFNFFWFLFCGGVAIIITATTEALLFTHTDGQTLWTFGSLLAFTLLVIPLEAFIFELYWLAVPETSWPGRQSNPSMSRRTSSSQKPLLEPDAEV